MTDFEEKARRYGVPIIPRMPPLGGFPRDPNPIVAICGECGLEIYQIMEYCCPRPNCPVGFEGPTCQTT